MKSLIRSIFKSRKKIFTKVLFINLFIKKIKLLKEKLKSLELKRPKHKVIVKKKYSSYFALEHKASLRKYLISHSSIAIYNVEFIMSVIEHNGCLFADKFLIEQLITNTEKKLKNNLNFSVKDNANSWQNLIVSQRINKNFCHERLKN